MDGTAGWPCQRLRLGYGLTLFFLFEVTLGQKLPMEWAFACLGLGLACLVSAFRRIRAWKFEVKLAQIRAAFHASDAHGSGAGAPP